jgi:hypothetical protein
MGHDLHPGPELGQARRLTPTVIGGARLVAGAGGGLYWIAAGIAFATAGAVGSAWVLLVEILR